MIKRLASIQNLTDQQLGFMLYYVLGDRDRPATLQSLLLRETIHRLGYDSGPPPDWTEDED